MYKAQIVADSVYNNSRITSMLLTYPRIIHGEFMTHRMFARNAASSRAIPFKKMVKDVIENTFIPIAWQKPHSGMQGTDYITDPAAIQVEIDAHLSDRDEAIRRATARYERGVTKQICNRYLEPFQYITVLVTATEWDNFFKLRCPEYIIDVPGDSIEDNWETKSFRSKRDVKKAIYSDDIDNWTDVEWLEINKSQAEIHIQHIAELMWDALNESTPKQLQPGEWHIPFGDKIDAGTISDVWLSGKYKQIGGHLGIMIKIATARCARLSYMTLGAEPKIDYEADIKLHDMLLESEHMSPFEHCARAMSNDEYYSNYNGELKIVDFEDVEESEVYLETNTMLNKDLFGWCRNFRGFIPYRHLIETR